MKMSWYGMRPGGNVAASAAVSGWNPVLGVSSVCWVVYATLVNCDDVDHLLLSMCSTYHWRVVMTHDFCLCRCAHRPGNM